MTVGHVESQPLVSQFVVEISTYLRYQKWISRLYVETEVHDVAILYDVLLALDAELTSLAYSSFRALHG